MKAQHKTWTERAIHAVGFELIAIAICAPVAAWWLDRPIAQAGAISLLLATLAMLWNAVYSMMFDRLWPPARIHRDLKLRLLHAGGFELGIVAFGVPLAAAVMQLPLMQALALEFGFILFMFPYTVAYNWAYDGLRRAWVKSR
ncbi:multidrug/biocide efflux PACE transporter [Comamonas humi]